MKKKIFLLSFCFLATILQSCGDSKLSKKESQNIANQQENPKIEEYLIDHINIIHDFSNDLKTNTQFKYLVAQADDSVAAFFTTNGAKITAQELSDARDKNIDLAKSFNDFLLANKENYKNESDFKNIYKVFLNTLSQADKAYANKIYSFYPKLLKDIFDESGNADLFVHFKQEEEVKKQKDELLKFFMTDKKITKDYAINMLVHFYIFQIENALTHIDKPIDFINKFH